MALAVPGCLYCFGSLVLSQQQRANGSKHLVLCGISSCKGIIHILCNHISNHGKAGIFQQTVDYIIVDLSGIKILLQLQQIIPVLKYRSSFLSGITVVPKIKSVDTLNTLAMRITLSSLSFRSFR